MKFRLTIHAVLALVLASLPVQEALAKQRGQCRLHGSNAEVVSAGATESEGSHAAHPADHEAPACHLAAASEPLPGAGAEGRESDPCCFLCSDGSCGTGGSTLAIDAPFLVGSSVPSWAPIPSVAIAGPSFTWVDPSAARGPPRF